MINQQSVVELRRKVNEAQKVLDLNIATWDPRTRPGVEGRQNKARQEIDGLKNDLSRKILEGSTTMLILQDVSIAPAIVQQAKENPDKVLLLDFLSTEKWLVKTIYGDNAKTFPFNSNVVTRMNILISDEVGDKIRATEMPVINANIASFGTALSREEILKKFETLMYQAYGTELKQNLFNVLLTEGIYDKLQQDEVAVFIMNVPVNFTKVLSSYTGKTIVVTEDASVPGALVINSESSAEELVGAITKAQTLVNKKSVKSTTKRKQTETTGQQDVD